MMSETSVAPKATPNRRRNDRGTNKAALQKAYASENDAAAIKAQGYYDAPQTPEKDISSSYGRNNNSHAQNTKSRQRKPKTAHMSPQVATPAQQTTPQRAASVSTNKTSMAFAGATFHASPAPSALPMPSFFAKPSTEATNNPSSNQPLQEPSPPGTDHEASTPNHLDLASRNTDSPLDFMFRAQREERERERRGSTLSQKNFTSNLSPFQSPVQHNLPRGAASVPHTRNPLTRQLSAGRIEGDELNGHQGLPMGPAFSTPYQERIRAARSNQSQQSPAKATDSPQQGEYATLEDKTEALKKFLFSGASSGAGLPSPSGPSPSTARSQRMQHASADGFPAELPANGSLRQPADASRRPNDFEAMEADLRKILKLGPDVSSTSADAR